MTINTELTYCPICRHELIEREVGGRLRTACDNCGYVHFVNPVPGVGMLIEQDDGLVLIQRGHPPHKGDWTLPGGFVEADESAEEAAIREAEEETGLKVEIIELAGINSFPEGPPTSGIMIFFRMKPIGGELQAGDDADDVCVFQADDLPPIPFRTHREMVAEWLEKYHHGSASVIEAAPRPDFLIRLAERDHFDEIVGLMMTIPANRNLSEEATRRIAQRYAEADSLTIFVAESTTEPKILLGFVALSVVRALTGSMGFINDMAVLPTFKRRGVGAELLEAVLRHAERLHLDTVLVNSHRANDQARAFYAALGFSDGEVMRLRLR